MLAEFKTPAVLWSSGKDSMVLLHLIRRVRGDLPVIFFRERWQPRRYDFANQLIMKWELVVYEWPPAATVLGTLNGRTSLINRYNFGAHKIDMPLLYSEPETWTAGCACALDAVMQPKGTIECPWDLLFHGHKSTDDHDCSGLVALQHSLVRRTGMPALHFPLRTWTDEDIWDYITEYNIPFQMDRYERIGDEVRERNDKSGNPDYLIGCQRCLNPDGPSTVYCPKLRMETNNISSQVARLDMKPDYIA